MAATPRSLLRDCRFLCRELESGHRSSSIGLKHKIRGDDDANWKIRSYRQHWSDVELAPHGLLSGAVDPVLPALRIAWMRRLS